MAQILLSQRTIAKNSMQAAKGWTSSFYHPIAEWCRSHRKIKQSNSHCVDITIQLQMSPIQQINDIICNPHTRLEGKSGSGSNGSAYHQCMISPWWATAYSFERSSQSEAGMLIFSRNWMYSLMQSWIMLMSTCAAQIPFSTFPQCLIYDIWQ